MRAVLAGLVDVWGYEEVKRCLEFAAAHQVSPARSARPPNPGQKRDAVGSFRKPSVSETIAKIGINPRQKSLLFELASRFEKKAFLPKLGDVRNFLEIQGQGAPGLKQRTDALHQILRAVSDLPEERLEKLVQRSSAFGPSQLGPLSDAIRAANVTRHAKEAPSANPHFDDSNQSKHSDAVEDEIGLEKPKVG